MKAGLHISVINVSLLLTASWLPIKNVHCKKTTHHTNGKKEKKKEKRARKIKKRDRLSKSPVEIGET